MTQIAHYMRFKEDHADHIKGLVAKIGKLSEEAHWDLIDEMKGAIGASAANDSTDQDSDQEHALSNSEEWVANNCSDGGIEEDVAMALWLRGTVEGETYLLSEMVVSLPRQQNRAQP